jgi:PAS domain S-box-containing protein
MLRPHLRFQSHLLPQSASALAVLVGGIVLLGWGLEIEALKSVSPGLATLKPITALCFIMSGSSLYFSSRYGYSRRLQWLGQGLAVAVALIASITLSEYIFRWDSGISQLLFKQRLAGNSGQMALSTAATFLPLALSLALPHKLRPDAVIAHILAIQALFIPLIGVMGYAFGVEALYAFVPYSSMALHTAITLSVLCVGTIFAQTELGVTALITSDTRGGTLARRLLPAALLIPLFFGFAVHSAEQRGWLDAEFGWALLVVANNLIFALLILWNSHSINQEENRRRQVEKALAYANRAYRTLSAGNHAVVRATNEQSLLDEVCRVMHEQGEYSMAWVGFKVNDEAKTVRPVAWSGRGEDVLLNNKLTWDDTEEGRRPSGTAIRTGKPVVMQKLATDPNFILYRDRALELGFGSAVALPLTNQGDVKGVLSVYAPEPDAFSDKELELLTEMAEDLAFGIDALHTHILHEQAKQSLESQNQRLSTLYKVGQIVNSALDVDKILDVVVDEAMRVTGAEHGLALIVNFDSGMFDRRSLRGFTPDEAARAEEMPLKLHLGLNGRAFRMREMIYIEDVQADIEYYPLLANSRSELVIPILREDVVLGNIDLQSSEVGAFRDIDTDYLKALAEQAALAITNARLYRELGTYNEYLEQVVAERTKQLAATRDRVEIILDSVGDALMVLRMDGSIEQINPAFEQQTGYTAVEAELKNYHDLLQLEFRLKRGYQQTLDTLAAGEVWQGEAIVHRKDASTYDAALTIAPVRDERSTVPVLIASMRDITPLKQVERAKDEFVSNVSHELRTPITSLRLNINMMRLNPVEQERYLERIERESIRLNDLIESLLRLSRLDQESVQLDLKLLDLNELAAQYVYDRTPLAESRELTLSFEGASALALVTVDGGLIGQALSVLLTNALNYTPAGGQVMIRTYQRVFNNQSWVGVSISDTGLGIPPSEIPQLFTRFFRGSVGRNSSASGTGLGLAIAKEIVERHAGWIEIISEGIPDKGTTFTLWLPQASPVAD